MSAMMLPENPDERRMFDCGVETYGTPLRYVSVMLAIWYKMAPEGGSYRDQLAIMANEVSKAAHRQQVTK